jgi:hypothetical protein
MEGRVFDHPNSSAGIAPLGEASEEGLILITGVLGDAILRDSLLPEPMLLNRPARQVVLEARVELLILNFKRERARFILARDAVLSRGSVRREENEAK